jgi:peptidoglycan hydrolase CwlO-like protein
MMTTLIVALAIVSFIAVTLAYIVGHDLWNVMKDGRKLKQAIAERDEAREADRISQRDLRMRTAEKKALDIAVSMMQKNESDQRAEIQALRLQVETIQKEAAEKQRTAAILQEESNKRIDELIESCNKWNNKFHAVREFVDAQLHA